MNRSLVEEITWDDYGLDAFFSDDSSSYYAYDSMDVSDMFYILSRLIDTIENFRYKNPFSNYAR